MNTLTAEENKLVTKYASYPRLLVFGAKWWANDEHPRISHGKRSLQLPRGKRFVFTRDYVTNESSRHHKFVIVRHEFIAVNYNYWITTRRVNDWVITAAVATCHHMIHFDTKASFARKAEQTAYIAQRVQFNIKNIWVIKNNTNKRHDVAFQQEVRTQWSVHFWRQNAIVGGNLFTDAGDEKRNGGGESEGLVFSISGAIVVQVPLLMIRSNSTRAPHSKERKERVMKLQYTKWNERSSDKAIGAKRDIDWQLSSR